MGLPLAKDVTMLDRMENDLRSKAQLALLDYPELGARVYGIYSLDDLEHVAESEITNTAVLGVGYVGCQVATPTTPSQSFGERSTAARMVQFNYVIIIGIATHDQLPDKSTAGRIMTALRSAILGSTISEDATSRMWDFVQEKPENSASTRSMVYYSQSWRVSVPIQARQQ